MKNIAVVALVALGYVIAGHAYAPKSDLGDGQRLGIALSIRTKLSDHDIALMKTFVTILA